MKDDTHAALMLVEKSKLTALGTFHFKDLEDNQDPAYL